MQSPYLTRRPVANSYLIRQRDRQRRSELLMVLVALLPLAAGLLVYTWIHLETLHTGYEINRLERHLHALDRQKRELQLEAADKARLERIETIAKDRLGMGEQDLAQTVYYEEIR